MHAVLALGLLLGFGEASAAGPEVWFALQDARLAESADRDLTAAVGIYETVLAHLPAGDSLQGELLLNLARARFDEGDIEGSRGALMQASGDLGVLGRVRAWKAQLDAWQRRVETLPLVWDASLGTGPLVLGWSSSAEAGLVVEGSTLVWHTIVRENRDDTLMLALGDKIGTVNSIAMRVESLNQTAHLRLIAEDLGGRRWATPVLVVEPGLQAEVLVAPGDLLPTHTGGPDELAPDRLRVLMLQDVTSFHSSARGANHLRLLAFELR